MKTAEKSIVEKWESRLWFVLIFVSVGVMVLGFAA
jgi:hypothetical protein